MRDENLGVHIFGELLEEECRTTLHHILTIAGMEIDMRAYSMEELREGLVSAISMHEQNKG